jgi:hypothetical protein
MSHSYGPIFAPPRIAPKAPPPTQGGTGGGGNSGGTSTSTSRKRAAERKATTEAAQPLTRTGPGCNAIRKLVEDHRAKSNKFSRLSDICTTNNFATLKDMCTAIGFNANKCLMWGLYCSCKGKCRMANQIDFSEFKPEQAMEIMLKASKA